MVKTFKKNCILITSNGFDTFRSENASLIHESSKPKNILTAEKGVSFI